MTVCSYPSAESSGTDRCLVINIHRIREEIPEKGSKDGGPETIRTSDTRFRKSKRGGEHLHRQGALYQRNARADNDFVENFALTDEQRRNTINAVKKLGTVPKIAPTPKKKRGMTTLELLKKAKHVDANRVVSKQASPIPEAVQGDAPDLLGLPYIPASCIAAFARSGNMPTVRDIEDLNAKIHERKARADQAEKDLRRAVAAAKAAVEFPISPEAAAINAADVRRAEDELLALHAKCEQDVKELEDDAWVTIRDFVRAPRNPLKNSTELHDEMKGALVDWLVRTVLEREDRMALLPTCQRFLVTHLVPEHFTAQAIKQRVYLLTKAAGVTRRRGRKPTVKSAQL